MKLTTLHRYLFVLLVSTASPMVFAQPSDQDFESVSAGPKTASGASSAYTVAGVEYSATYTGTDNQFVHDADIGVFLSPQFLSIAANFGGATEARIVDVSGNEFKFNGMDISFGSCNACSGLYALVAYRDGAAISGSGKIIFWDGQGPAAAFDVSSAPEWGNLDEIRITRPGGDFYIAVDNLNFDPAEVFSVGGTITGLAFNNAIALQNNGGNTLILSEQIDVPGGTGTFTFTGQLVFGDTYSVSVLAQSAGQTCTVSNGAGTIASSDINNVQINCVNKTYSVGGQISGLVSGDTVVLQNNLGDDLAVSSNGAFTFSSPVAYTDAYSVTVLSQPSAPSETCTVTNGAGTVSNGDVNTVSITCAVNNFAVSGSVSGLTSGGSIELRNNGADSQTLAANGPFTFAALADGSAYSVTVASQPDGQTCSVAPSGSGTLSGADVNGVSVSCVNNSYVIGGSLSGLVSGDTVVLQNNGGDNLTLSGNGVFSFATPVAFGSPYSATVLTQPSAPSENCAIANGSGTTPSANVSSIVVTCTLDTFPISGAVSGLASGNTLTLQLNGADNQLLTGNTTFNFTPIADGSNYAVTVASQPKGQTCAVTSGTGTLAGSAVTNVAVSCTSNQYTVGGLLSGLVTGDTVVLQNNSGDDLTLTADGAFAFATLVGFGDIYAVTVSGQPSQPSEACSVTNGSGTMAASNVTNVSIICALNSFAVGGSVSGLAAGETVVLQNRGANDRSITADGNFVFAAQADGSNYAITVASQPADQTCTISGGNGTLAGADVSSVSVTCRNTPPKKIPTVPLWLLGMMALLLAGISSRRLRRA